MHSGTVDMPTTSASNTPKETILSPRLKIRPRDGNKHSLLNFDLQTERDSFSQRNQLFRIRLGHIGKPGAEAFVVRTDQRIVAK